jgi:WD40 repeat protein
MAITSYRNFDLLITRAGASYKAIVVDAPAGDADILFDLPWAAEMTAGLSGLAQGPRRSAETAGAAATAADVTALGQSLFAAVFRERVQAALAASLSSVAAEGAGLRVRLRFQDDTADLAALPWETLYDPVQCRFVALGEASPVVRYLALPRPRTTWLVEPPLRVLAMLASPHDLPSLDVEREWQALQAALAGLVADRKFVLERLATPTLAGLQERLLGDPVHILHFVGHGVFDRGSATGGLALEDDRGSYQLVSGAALGQLLRNHQAVRLAYLNACEGALASGASVFGGVAQALVKEGVPAAVAMQAEISDAGAIELTRTFYAALAAGRPVDAALTQARVALSVAGSDEWAIPVLFSRSDDNRLFDIREVLPTPDCPYPGMTPFSEAQQELFFGRDKEIEAAVQRLRQHPFLAVIGPSGSGKSSLIYAGVIPTLRHSRVFGPGEWQVLTMRPGDSRTPDGKGAPAAGLAQLLNCPPQALASATFAQRTLLFVDQFEEVLTLAEAGEAQTFLDALAALRERPNLYLLLTARADFYPELMACPLWEAIQANRLELTTLGDDALRAAIVEPADRVSVKVDEALAVQLIADARGEQGNLPLVQETLVLLWDKVARRELKLAAYQQMGEGGRNGLQVAIDRRASSVYDNLPSEAQPLARRIFLRLIQFGEGRADTRRQQTAAELAASGDDPALFDRTLARLVESRLLTASGEAGGAVTGGAVTGGAVTGSAVTGSAVTGGAVSGGAERRIDIAHEALIVGWPRLQEWLGQRRTAERTRRRLEAKAAEWLAAQRQGGLLDEYELLEAETWLAAEDAAELGSSRALEDLVTASRTAITRAADEKAAQQRREVEQAQKLAEEQRLRAEESDRARRGLRGRLIAATAAVAIALVFLAAAVIFGRQAQTSANAAYAASTAEARQKAMAEAASTAAVNERNNAQAASTRAVEQQKAAEASAAEAQRQSAVARSRQLAAQSASAANGDQSEIALPLAIEAGRAIGAIEPGGLEAFEAIGSALARPWRLGRVLYGHTGPVTQATWSGDASKVLTAGDDGTARIWDAASGRALAVLDGHTAAVNQATWSRDESKVLTASADGTARIWDAASGQELAVLEGHEGPVPQATWSRDESRVLTASDDGTARIWDAASGQALAVLKGHERAVNQATWNRDGSKVLTASDDGTARIWDAASGKELARLKGHRYRVTQAAWSGDESKVLTASEDGTARIWDAASGKELAVLEGHEGPIYQATWSRDESKVLTRSADGTARIWDAANRQELAVLRGHKLPLRQATWSRDESRVLTAGNDGTARIWDAASGKELAVLKGHKGPVYQTAWSRDESRVLTAGDDDTARIWDAASGQELAVLKGHTADVNQATWSGDESEVLTRSADGTARIWDAASGQALAVLEGHEDSVYQATWSRDESQVLTVSEDGTARIWDAASGQALAVLKGHERAVNQATWNRDGSKVLTASADGAARIWDAASGQELAVLKGHEGTVYKATWSRDESKVLTAGYDGTARIWDAASGKELARLKGHENAVWQAMWSRDASRVLTASYDGTVRIWDAASGQELAVLKGHEESNLFQATWSRDESRVLTATGDGTARIWDAANGQELAVLEGHTDWVIQATWSRDESQVLTASYDGTARIWDAASGQALAVLKGHTADVNQATWSWDETKVLTAGDDGTALIWDAASGKELAVLKGHESTVYQATWNRDGSKVLTASSDGTARIWDAASGQELAVLKGHEGYVNQATWSQDESKVLTAGGDGAARIWDARLAGLVQTSCGRMPRNLAWAEWDRFMDGDYRPTCSQAPIPPDTIQAVREQAAALAIAGETMTATARLEQLNGWLQKNGQLRTNGVDSEVFLAAALLGAGKGEEGLKLLPAAPLATGELDNLSLEELNSLCRYGSLWGRAAQVLPACDQALRLAEVVGSGLPDAHDSRGLARALTGDIQGAIQDFGYYVEYTKDYDSGRYEKHGKRREAWVAALAAGQDPRKIFDEATLAELRRE